MNHDNAISTTRFSTRVKHALIQGSCVVALTLSPLVHAAEAKESAEISQKLAMIAEQHSLPALAAVRLNKDGSIDYGLAGKRRSNSDKRIELNDAWHIGSITKSMTSSLALILVREGVITLDTKVDDVWPDAHIHASMQGVTLRDLLTHTSGITDNPGTVKTLKAVFDDRPLRLQRSEWALSSLDGSAKVERGTFLYSNLGYMVAGAMLEKLSNRNFEELLHAQLFKPLGMQQVGYGAPEGEQAIWGHKSLLVTTKSIEPGPGADNPAAMAPAGTLHLSLLDMVRYMKLHLGHHPELLNKTELATLHTPAVGATYAMGWIAGERPWANGTALFHNGSNTMWVANLWLAPENNEGFFVVTNIASQKAFLATEQAINVLISTRR